MFFVRVCNWFFLGLRVLRAVWSLFVLFVFEFLVVGVFGWVHLFYWLVFACIVLLLPLCIRFRILWLGLSWLIVVVGPCSFGLTFLLVQDGCWNLDFPVFAVLFFGWIRRIFCLNLLIVLGFRCIRRIIVGREGFV